MIRKKHNHTVQTNPRDREEEPQKTNSQEDKVKEPALSHFPIKMIAKIVSEYDQEIPQSQTAGNPWHHEEEPLNHHETPGRQIKQNNQLSLPHQDECNTRMDISNVQQNIEQLQTLTMGVTIKKK